MAAPVRTHDNAFLAPLSGALPVLSADNGVAAHTWHMRGMAAAATPAADPAAAAAATADATPKSAHSEAPATTPAAATAAAVSVGTDYALIILTAATQAQSLFPHLWSGARVRICADGGSSRLYERVPPQLRDRYVPHIICGDFDSSQKPVLDFYQQRGAELQHIVDDDCTDLEKCIALLKQRQTMPQWRVSTVVVYGAFGGRFDHVIRCVHTLYMFAGAFDRLLLFGEDNLAELLTPGKHVIRCHPRIEPAAAPKPAATSAVATAATAATAAAANAATAAADAKRVEREPEPVTCGLLPIGGVARRVTTTGLKWNVTDAAMQFGGLVSSSNIIADAIVTVDTSDPLVWTTSPLTAF